MHVDGFSLVPREHPPQEDLKEYTAFFFWVHLSLCKKKKQLVAFPSTSVLLIQSTLLDLHHF